MQPATGDDATTGPCPCHNLLHPFGKGHTLQFNAGIRNITILFKVTDHRIGNQVPRRIQTVSDCRVRQMRDRGLRSVLLHTSRPMIKQRWCCWTVKKKPGRTRAQREVLQGQPLNGIRGRYGCFKGQRIRNRLLISVGREP